MSDQLAIDGSRIVKKYPIDLKDLDVGTRIQVSRNPIDDPLPETGTVQKITREMRVGTKMTVIAYLVDQSGITREIFWENDPKDPCIDVLEDKLAIEEQKAQTIPLWPGERQEIPGNSLIKFNIIDYFIYGIIKFNIVRYFIYGIGSVLEFFPSPERFDVWRVAQDVPINEGPLAVRRLLAELQEDASQRGVPS